MVRSAHRPRKRARDASRAAPRPTVAKRSASTPRIADTGKCSRMMSFTERFCWVKEIPKSPFAMLRRKTPYWTSTGRSSP